MKEITAYFYQLDELASSLIIFAIAIVIGFLVKYILFRLLDYYNRHSNPYLVKSLTRHLNHPLSYFIPLLFLSVSLSIVPLKESQVVTSRRIVEILDIIVFAWILIKVTFVIQDMVRYTYIVDKSDNIRERKLITQLQFIKKLSIVLIIFIALSIILLSFEPVRKLGTGLLTSAGIAGIIVGFAAQKSLANLLAGMQLAFTQPIRIDDVLVVEGEFGRVEEITLTYVVLKLWDNRRLILPLNYFIEKPFQNWTRTGADLIATVYLYMDYSVPVDEVRAEFSRILKSTDLWDGKSFGLQVTDATENTLQLRALMSAASSGIAWDLRCLVREKLVTFIQQHYPGSLPKMRTAFTQYMGLQDKR
jgi:small-conductance mechanosensitive channel